MGGGSWSKGCEFESQHQILNGYFFTLICCKNYKVCLKTTELNEKEAGDSP